MQVLLPSAPPSAPPPPQPSPRRPPVALKPHREAPWSHRPRPPPTAPQPQCAAPPLLPLHDLRRTHLTSGLLKHPGAPSGFDLFTRGSLQTAGFCMRCRVDRSVRSQPCCNWVYHTVDELYLSKGEQPR